jgi:hypothetical protein
LGWLGAGAVNDIGADPLPAHRRADVTPLARAVERIKHQIAWISQRLDPQPGALVQGDIANPDDGSVQMARALEGLAAVQGMQICEAQAVF